MTQAYEIGRLSPSEHPRRAWANCARSVLAHHSDEIILRPLEERISIAAASYDFWLERLGYPEVGMHNHNDLHALVEKLPDEERRLLAEDLGLQAVALRNLTIPNDYFEFIKAVNDQAYEVVLKTDVARELMPLWADIAEQFIDRSTGRINDSWLENLPDGQSIPSAQARQHIDAAGITHDKCLALMNCISVSMNDAYIAVMDNYEIEDKPSPMQVRGFIWDQANPAEKADQHRVWTDENGTYYRVSDRSETMLDPRALIHTAFHEPHHYIQKRLSALHQSGIKLPDGLEAARQIFDLRHDYQIRNCSPSVFFVSDRLRDLAMDVYRLDPVEETALHQGLLAELPFSRDYMPSAGPGAQHMLKQRSHWLERMPSEIQNWFNKFYGPKNGVMLVSAQAKDEPKI